jgi:hypothetical protein
MPITIRFLSASKFYVFRPELPATTHSFDDFESYSVGGITSLTGVGGWAANGVVLEYIPPRGYDDFSLYATGNLDYLSSGSGWSGTGSIMETYIPLRGYDEFSNYFSGSIYNQFSSSISYLSSGSGWSGTGSFI